MQTNEGYFLSCQTTTYNKKIALKVIKNSNWQNHYSLYSTRLLKICQSPVITGYEEFSILIYDKCFFRYSMGFYTK